jgi:DNA mismatch endonuclease, patch repair protein
MSRVRSKNSRPEMAVRKVVYALGHRYRLHQRSLPGCPDLVFLKTRKVIFVHGCFWHRHDGCALARMPKSRLDFWRPKLEANKERDERNKQKLAGEGWQVLTIWECEIKDAEQLRTTLKGFLDA